MAKKLLDNNNKNQLKKKKKRIYLNYYKEIPEIPEYYSYIDSDGIEKKFEDKTYNIFKSGTNKIIARKNSVSKISLTYVPAKQEIKYQKGYFITEDGTKYDNTIYFDKDTESYYGIKRNISVYENKIQLSEE